MLNAHTIAVTATGRADRVINTQDVFHGALGPAALSLVLTIGVAWFAGRRVHGETTQARPVRERIGLTDAVTAAVALVALLILLGGVATGYFYAVEAAAMGATALLLIGFVTGRLHGPVLRAVLADAMAMTGALFALLIAATTLTLVLRLLGTDRLVGDWLIAMPGSEKLVVAVVLAAIGLSAFVLDAFEIIFVIVPIVIPPLLVRVADARWVAALVLLTLQTSFLLPPFGYALMMVRGILKGKVTVGALTRALLPFLLAQWAVLAVVLAVPQLTHLGEKEGAASRAPERPLSKEELNRRIEELLPPPPDIPALEIK
jgi:TRAP-type mannitol/chloroaromatic compound transport system permease large subunit